MKQVDPIQFDRLPKVSTPVTQPLPARDSSDRHSSDISPSTRRWVMLAILSGVAMASLDSAIANIALPSIARELIASDAASVWVVNAFQLGTALCLLPAAALGEIY